MEVNGPTKRATIGILAVSIAMLFSLLIPTQTADASSGPCPNYSIQNVFDNPDGNWDGDQVNNSDELYNGMNPCIADSAAFCSGGGNVLCSYAQTYTYNYTYSDPYYQADPYYHAGYRRVEFVQKNTLQNPCHHATFNLPLGDFDGDGVSNGHEVSRGTDPCVFNSRTVVARQVATVACPYYTADHVTAAPNYDWDGDGVTNLVEWRRGTNPCVSNSVTYYQPQTTTINRLPHVSTTTTYTPPPVVRSVRPTICPAGYPYFHTATGQCYANPIRNSFG